MTVPGLRCNILQVIDLHQLLTKTPYHRVLKLTGRSVRAIDMYSDPWNIQIGHQRNGQLTGSDNTQDQNSDKGHAYSNRTMYQEFHHSSGSFLLGDDHLRFMCQVQVARDDDRITFSE